MSCFTNKLTKDFVFLENSNDVTFVNSCWCYNPWKTRQKEWLRNCSFAVQSRPFIRLSLMMTFVAVCGFCESMVSHHHFTLFCTAAHLMYMLWLLTCQAFLHRFISLRVRIKPYISQRNGTPEKKNKTKDGGHILWEMSNELLLYFWFSIFSNEI